MKEKKTEDKQGYNPLTPEIQISTVQKPACVQPSVTSNLRTEEEGLSEH